VDIRIIRGMDERRVGSALRAIRRHRRWSLEHAAARAGLSSATASRIETGRLDRCSFHALDAYSRTLGADLSFSLRWRGGDLDRLLNRRHSYMHERMARIWQGLPEWQAVPEHSFSIFGERGVIDWFSWHGGSRTVLIDELKSQFVDVQELVGTNDRRMRLAPMIARALGWNPRLIAS